MNEQFYKGINCTFAKKLLGNKYTNRLLIKIDLVMLQTVRT